MSLPLSRASLHRAVGILACVSSLIVLGGCYHRSYMAGPTTVGRQQANHDFVRHFSGVDIVLVQSGAFVVEIHSGMVGDGDPLYIIDGTPMTIDPHRGIGWFKPEDIEQIKVLKTPAETSVYGPRGVNGVIVITTKQGMRPRM